jgi:hypothetical protein
MITKIDTRKIEHQSNIKIFVWKCDNLIENKKQIMNTNSKSITYWRIRLKKRAKKDSIARKKIRRWNKKKLFDIVIKLYPTSQP